MKRYILYLIFCMPVCYLQAQNNIHSDVTSSEDSQAISYLESVSNYAIIYSGKEEARYPNSILNHPYLDTDKFRKGLVSFDGIVYPNVNMRLNLHKEELIVLSPDNRFTVVLPENRVDFATIDSLFIFYNSPLTGERQFSEGYHVRLYKGAEYEVWKREVLFLESRIKELMIAYSFTKKRKFYLYRSGVYHSVSSKNSVLKLLDPTRTKELKKYIKQHKLGFKKSPEEAIVSVINYYETLSR